MPTWDQFMVPVLEVLSDGETRRLRDLYGLVADHVGLTTEERAEVISSGMLRHHDRIGWAASDLVRATAVERPSRGLYRITDVGRELLQDHPQRITQKDLRTIPAYTDSLAAAQAAKSAIGAPVANVQSQLSPEEQIGQAIDLMNADVADDFLNACMPRSRRSLNKPSSTFLWRWATAVPRAMQRGGSFRTISEVGILDPFLSGRPRDGSPH